MGLGASSTATKPNQAAVSVSLNRDGSTHHYGDAKQNAHGEKEFIVKMQPPAGPGVPAGSPWMCYDGPKRSFQTLVPGDTENLERARELLVEKGIRSQNPHMPEIVGYKGFFKAVWEGEKVRVWLDDLAEVQDW